MEQKILVSKQEAAQALGVSVRTLENLLAGELRSVRVGRRRLIPIRELERFARTDHCTQPKGRAEEAVSER